ncbi:hypothetical protein ABN225_03350 [Providencia alcalifaciens]
MKFVIQPSSQEGCGIATLAMLANKSFSEMEKEMKLKELVLRNNFVTVNQMALGLKDLMKVDYIQLRRLSTWDPKKNYICFCREPEGSEYPYRHWMLYINGHYYDPLNKKKMPTRETKHRTTTMLEIPSLLG